MDIARNVQAESVADREAVRVIFERVNIEHQVKALETQGEEAVPRRPL
jgi:hypothetical protein